MPVQSSPGSPSSDLTSLAASSPGRDASPQPAASASPIDPFAGDLSNPEEAIVEQAIIETPAEEIVVEVVEIKVVPEPVVSEEKDKPEEPLENSEKVESTAETTTPLPRQPKKVKVTKSTKKPGWHHADDKELAELKAKQDANMMGVGINPEEAVPLTETGRPARNKNRKKIIPEDTDDEEEAARAPKRPRRSKQLSPEPVLVESAAPLASSLPANAISPMESQASTERAPEIIESAPEKVLPPLPTLKIPASAKPIQPELPKIKISAKAAATEAISTPTLPKAEIAPVEKTADPSTRIATQSTSNTDDIARRHPSKSIRESEGPSLATSLQSLSSKPAKLPKMNDLPKKRAAEAVDTLPAPPAKRQHVEKQSQQASSSKSQLVKKSSVANVESSANRPPQKAQAPAKTPTSTSFTSSLAQPKETARAPVPKAQNDDLALFAQLTGVNLQAAPAQNKIPEGKTAGKSNAEGASQPAASKSSDVPAFGTILHDERKAAGQKGSSSTSSGAAAARFAAESRKLAGENTPKSDAESAPPAKTGLMSKLSKLKKIEKNAPAPESLTVASSAVASGSSTPYNAQNGESKQSQPEAPTDWSKIDTRGYTVEQFQAIEQERHEFLKNRAFAIAREKRMDLLAQGKVMFDDYNDYKNRCAAINAKLAATPLVGTIKPESEHKTADEVTEDDYFFTEPEYTVRPFTFGGLWTNPQKFKWFDPAGSARRRARIAERDRKLAEEEAALAANDPPAQETVVEEQGWPEEVPVEETPTTNGALPSEWAQESETQNSPQHTQTQIPSEWQEHSQSRSHYTRPSQSTPAYQSPQQPIPQHNQPPFANQPGPSYHNHPMPPSMGSRPHPQHADLPPRPAASSVQPPASRPAQLYCAYCRGSTARPPPNDIYTTHSRANCTSAPPCNNCGSRGHPPRDCPEPQNRKFASSQGIQRSYGHEHTPQSTPHQLQSRQSNPWQDQGPTSAPRGSYEASSGWN